jgi:serine/threonine-protein kinase
MGTRRPLIRLVLNAVIVIFISSFFLSCQKKGPQDQIIVESSNVSVGTFAGSGSEGFADGFGSAASFFMPTTVATDRSGNVYVSDTGNGLIRKLNEGGYVNTFAGVAGDYSTPIGFPYGIAIDAAGNIYLGDVEHNQIRKISPQGVISTLAGNGNTGFQNGPGSTASFNQPYGLAVDGYGNVYVADAGNNAIRKIAPGGMVSTYAGSGAEGTYDGPAAEATFYSPYGVCVDVNGNVFVADTFNQLIRKINTGGIVTTVAGGGAPGSESPGFFKNPFGVAADAAGNLYVADFGANRVLEINPSGQVLVLAGSGQKGAANGPNITATFNGPSGVAVSVAGNVFVADAGNNLIREIYIQN